MNPDLITKLAVTWEVVNGSSPSEGVINMIISDLEKYHPEQVSASLDRCRLEVKGRLNLAEIVSRIDDGWPTADEAWALVPKSENVSTVWCDEIADCWYQVSKLYSGEWDYDTLSRSKADPIAARLAFRAVYEKAVVDARAEHRSPKWWLSRGLSGADCYRVLLDAVRHNRLTAEDAMRMNPELEPKRTSDVPPALPAHEGLDESTREMIAEAKTKIDGIVRKMTLR